MLHQSNIKRFYTLLLVVFISMLLTTSISGEETKNNSFNISKSAIANLNIGIKSSNPGLKRSSIQLAGKYLLNEASEALLDQLKIEKEASTRILITKVLYLIGNDKFLDDIAILASQDEDEKVRKFATSVISMMKMEKFIKIADINK